MARPRYLVVDGCPCPYDVAPYVYLVLRRASQSASSIYRGDDALALLHRHGRHTQREIYNDPAYAGKANPPGFSQHELFSDGIGNPRVRRGGKLEPWQVGVDSGGDDQASKDRVTRAAHHYGLHVKHPYNRGVEGHHWDFSRQPHPNRHLRKYKVIAVRARLRLNK
jgi:hypothetical protein